MGFQEISWAESKANRCVFRSVGRLSLVSSSFSISHPDIEMSMFSGLTNQISGWVANKTGQGADPNAPQDPNAAPVDPNDPNYAQNGAEVPVDPNDQGQGGMAGMAQGFLAKAMAAKDGLKDKA